MDIVFINSSRPAISIRWRRELRQQFRRLETASRKRSFDSLDKKTTPSGRVSRKNVEERKESGGNKFHELDQRDVAFSFSRPPYSPSNRVSSNNSIFEIAESSQRRSTGNWQSIPEVDRLRVTATVFRSLALATKHVSLSKLHLPRESPSTSLFGIAQQRRIPAVRRSSAGADE